MLSQLERQMNSS